jgi:hypothetical protein
LPFLVYRFGLYKGSHLRIVLSETFSDLNENSLDLIGSSFDLSETYK